MRSSLLDRVQARSMLLASCTLFTLSTLLGACAAKLENPEDFADRTELPSAGGAPSTGSAGASSSSAGSGAVAGSTSNTTTPDCVLAIFKASTGSCAGSVCHDQGAASAGDLDLASPNVAQRLIDQPALHTDVGAGASCPSGDKLIDTGNRGASWLLQKLNASSVGTCGSRMPEGGNLTSIQLACLQNWVDTVAPGGS